MIVLTVYIVPHSIWKTGDSLQIEKYNISGKRLSSLDLLRTQAFTKDGRERSEGGQTNSVK